MITAIADTEAVTNYSATIRSVIEFMMTSPNRYDLPGPT